MARPFSIPSGFVRAVKKSDFSVKKHQALALALIILGSAVCDAVGQQGPAESNQPASSGKPNVIYILADDLGYGDLSCYGQKKFQTPNIDRLASEGMKFTDHYSGRAVCSPSRACLMTGQHPGRIHCPAPTSTASETPGGIGGNQKINRNRDFSVGRSRATIRHK